MADGSEGRWYKTLSIGAYKQNKSLETKTLKTKKDVISTSSLSNLKSNTMKNTMQR